MPASASPPWSAGFYSRRHDGHVNPGMRVSDAERAEVSDRLSRHYADGRLDQAEFDERMGRAMNAKTHGDFDGLFADLPDLPDQQGGPGGPGGVGAQAQPGQQWAAAQPGARPPVVRYRYRGPLYRIAVLALVIVAAAAVGHALVHSFFPLLLIALVAFLLLRGRPGHRF